MTETNKPADPLEGRRFPREEPTAYTRAMNAAQLDQAVSKYRDSFQKAVAAMELRKVAMEAAIRIYENQLHQTIVSPVDPVTLARDIYQFLAGSHPTDGTL